MVIQETKMTEVCESLVVSLWGNPLCDWSFTSSIANSEGLLSIWCSCKGMSIFYFSGPDFLRVFFLKWGASKPIK